MSDFHNPYATPQTLPIADPLAASGMRVPASFGWRFLASLIDGILMFVAGLMVGFVIGIICGVVLPRGTAAEVAGTLGNLVGILINWLYYALMESSDKQATFGKMVLGIKVTDMEGKRISFARATGRHFGKFLSAIILGIGFLMMLWDDKKQTLHDKMSGCLLNDVRNRA